MDKLSFPAVKAKSSRESLTLLGIDEGDILQYNPNSGMYVVSKEGEDIGPDESYSYFAESVGFSRSVINALLEAGIVEEIVVPEPESEKAKAKDVESWETAELTMVCGRCGHEEKITDAFGAATIYMPTNSGSEVRLACDNCGNIMTLLYRGGRDLTEEEKAEIKAQQEEQKKQREQVDKIPEEVVKAQEPMTNDDAYKESSDEPQEKSD